ncbi:MAG: FtsQ-type POTRA domain-containing protein [bacterium]
MYVKNIYLNKKRHYQKKRQEARSDFFRLAGKTLTALVGMAIVVSLFWITRNFVLVTPYFNVKNIVVSGNNIVPKEDIIKLTGIEFGQNIFKLNLIKIQYRIKESPLFDKVHVKRCLPDKIEVHVEEREASAILNMKVDFYLVSGDGIIFQKLSSVIYKNLPIITGVELKSVILGDDTNSFSLKTGLKIVKDIKSVQPEFLDCISEINVSCSDEIIIYTDSGTKLKIDKDTEKSKWFYVNKAISAANADKISIEYVDMRYNKQIVLKRKT